MIKSIHWIVFLFFSFIGLSYAADPIVIEGGSNKAVSIAVVPFSKPDTVELSDDISKVISTDLLYSGLFDPLPQQTMLSSPSKPDQVSFRDWSAVNAQYLLIGNVSSENGRLYAHYYLYNVATERQVYSGKASSSPKHVRGLAHYIADQVFEKMTGTKGAFSTKLMYVLAEGNHNYKLMLADYDGENSVTLFRSSEPILSPRFSPDGKQVAYVSFESKRPRIYIQQLATGERKQFTNFSGLNSAPTWSPDGKQLAVVLSKDGNPEIYTMDVASHQLRRLTNNFSIDTEPFWLKGGTIYFTSDRSGKPQVYRLDVKSGNTKRVTSVGNYNANPKLSEDEKMLVMVHRQDGYRNFTIAAQDLTTGRVRILSNTNMDESPTIAPNGSMIIYATRAPNKGPLVLVSSNGRVRIKLPVGGADAREPSWSGYIK